MVKHEKIGKNPVSPICPINYGYQILNGLCMPIMHSKSPLPNEMSCGNVSIIPFRWIIQTLKMMITIILVLRMNLMMNFLSESNTMKHLLTVYLFKSKNILLCLTQFCSEVVSKTKFLLVIVFF